MWPRGFAPANFIFCETFVLKKDAETRICLIFKDPIFYNPNFIGCRVVTLNIIPNVGPS